MSSTERGSRLRYIPALDGVRGLAVAAVVLYHAHVPHLVGGQLGVTVFFTLSGFLITSLLLVERSSSGRISLRSFWARRARRLVPALLVCLLLVAVVIHYSPQPAGSGVVGDAVAGALWVANWRFIVDHQTYADLFSMPSPFQHFWSLAVEEQYYLVFPVVAAAVLARGGRRVLATLLGQAAVVSAALSVLLVAHATTVTRAYYGTDTRIGEILVGALLALLVVRDGDVVRVRPRTRRALDALAVVALAVLGLLVTSLPYGDLRLFRGGLLLAAISTAAVLAAVTQPGSLVGRALAFRPLVLLGTVSYGVYLFHWPLFLLIDTQTTGVRGGALLAARIAPTLALAAASCVLVEQPVRHGQLRLGPGLATWAVGAMAGVTAIALAAGVISMPPLEPQTTVISAPAPGAVAAAPSLAAAKPHSPRGRSRTGATRAASPVVTMPTSAAPARTRSNHGSRAAPPVMRNKEFVGDGEDYAKAPPLPTVPAGALKVLVVGDSIGNNLGRGLVSWSGGRTDVAVYNLAIPACPVSRGSERRLDPDHDFPVLAWCGWWDDTSSARYQAAVQFAPDVVVVEDGINATFERRQPSWSNWEKPGVPQFDDWMGSEYQTFADTFRGLGAKVLLANAPCADWERLFPEITDGPQRVSDLDDIDYPRVLGVTSANFFNEVCPNGRYSDTVDGVDNARPDGFHFTDEAALALARDWLGPMLLQVGKPSLGAPTG